jgi:hypothetical protein
VTTDFDAETRCWDQVLPPGIAFNEEIVMSRLLSPVVCAALLLGSGARLSAQEWAEKMFDKLSHDLGVVAKGADTKYRLSLTNRYAETMYISNVSTSCGCFAARALKDTLQSRETTEIEVTVDTRRFERQRDASITVTFGGQFPAQVRLPIRVYIRTDVVVTPGAVEFGSVPKGQSAERRVSVAYAGRQNWSIKEVVNKNPHLDVKLVERGRGSGRVDYDLAVTLKPDAPLGEIGDQVQLVTDDANNPFLPVSITGRVETEFTVNPGVLAFGTLAPGEKKTINVVVRGRRPFVIDKIESDKTAGVFQVRLPPEAKTVHVLPITITAPTDATSLEDTFTISIVGNAAPVEFRATGKVEGPATTQVKTPGPSPQ